jgi:hypothetical protein
LICGARRRDGAALDLPKFLDIFPSSIPNVGSIFPSTTIAATAVGSSDKAIYLLAFDDAGSVYSGTLLIGVLEQAGCAHAGIRLPGAR